MKKQTKLAVVPQPSANELDKRIAKREEEEKPWKEMAKKARITPIELRQRVSALRDELEDYQRQLEALPFDIPHNDTPYPLDFQERKYHVELIETFNPTLCSLFDMIDEYAEQHGCHELLDFNSKLFELKAEYAATGFRIGVLAGAIFAGCPKDIVDRFTRGLEFAGSTPGARMLRDWE